MPLCNLYTKSVKISIKWQGLLSDKPKSKKRVLTLSPGPVNLEAGIYLQVFV